MPCLPFPCVPFARLPSHQWNNGRNPVFSKKHIILSIFLSVNTFYVFSQNLEYKQEFRFLSRELTRILQNAVLKSRQATQWPRTTLIWHTLHTKRIELAADRILIAISESQLFWAKYQTLSSGYVCASSLVSDPRASSADRLMSARYESDVRLLY